MKNKRPKKYNGLKNANMMDYLVIICIVTIQLYVSVSLYQYYTYGIATSDLTSYIFGFFGGELLAMATITISKNRNKSVESEWEVDSGIDEEEEK